MDSYNWRIYSGLGDGRENTVQGVERVEEEWKKSRRVEA